MCQKGARERHRLDSGAARGIGAWMPCPAAALPIGVDVSAWDMAKAFVGGSLAPVGTRIELRLVVAVAAGMGN